MPRPPWLVVITLVCLVLTFYTLSNRIHQADDRDVVAEWQRKDGGIIVKVGEIQSNTDDEKIDEEEEIVDDEDGVEEEEPIFEIQREHLVRCGEVLRTQEKDGEPALPEAMRDEICRQFFKHASKVAGIYPGQDHPHAPVRGKDRRATLKRTILLHSFNKKYIPLFMNWVCYLDIPLKFFVYVVLLRFAQQSQIIS